MVTAESKSSGLIILPNGRHVPTFKGSHFTKDHKDKMIKSQKGRSKSRESVEKRSTVWNIVGPLYARGALVGEMVELTDLTPQQVENSIKRNKYRPEWSQIEPFDINAHDNRRKGAKRFKKRRESGISEDEKRGILFARELIFAGLITDDVSNWDRLEQMYRRNGIQLRDDFAYRLILELFLAARVMADNGDRSMIERYVRMGTSFDRDWFTNQRMTDDRHFIMEQLSKSSLARNGVIYARNGRDGDGQRLNNAFGFLREAGVIVYSDS